MEKFNIHNGLLALTRTELILIVMLFLVNFFFNIYANVAFKISATGADWRHFLIWQVIGNLCGFLTVLTLTAMLRYLPLHVVFPITSGLAVLGVQVFAARFYFHEMISPAQWAGSLLIVGGIYLIGAR
ncbi:MAG: hypothetical protein ACPL7A_00400 [Anaerolineales bacterium]